ncbi:MAG TPA: TonB-dependent receptor plug domain-containing protein [Opitutaceae bacterium]|nr:TonB-dependent receptor plug domain-containing protein [Opitutaceae bacterium]
MTHPDLTLPRKAGAIYPAALALALFGAGLLPAQTTPPPTSNDTVELSPFEVKAESDKSYGALNSNSITAFSTQLKTMPVSADVFSQQFMDDVGATTVEDMIETFSAGAGYAATSPDQAAANSQPGDRNAGSVLSLRGLAAPVMQINGFFPSGGGGISATGITSNFDLERVEVVSGPQALLYGVSGAGGVVNLVTKQARFNHGASAAFKFQLDQYGHKLGQFDYSIGGRKLAFRLAVLDQQIGNRRVNLGGPLQGLYTQLAYRPFRNTTIRFSWERSNMDRINPNSGGLTMSGLTSSLDARNGQTLHWLLATNQVQAAANGGPSSAGPIMNGNLNWDNIDSLAGAMSGETQRHSLETLTIDNRWTRWLSTQLGLGYRTETRKKVGNSSVSFLAPGAASNPLNTWAISMGGGSNTYLWEPVRQKVIRFSALAQNDLFGGRAHSETVVGADFTRSDSATNSYYWVQADDNWNPVRTSAVGSNGLILMPTQYWAVTNGPITYPLWNREDTRTIIGGVKYIRFVSNDTVASLVSPKNPEGLTGHGTGDFRHESDFQSGIYAANFTNWFDDRLTTLAGFRSGKAYSRNQSEAAAPYDSVLHESIKHYVSFNVGVNYKLTKLLRPYVEFSDSYNPAGGSADPYGHPMQTANGLGEEGGFKIANPSGTVSGSLALYHTRSKNETMSFTSTLENDINPAGLNGRWGPAGNTVNVDRETQGAQFMITAAPTSSWRIRFSAATIQGRIATDHTYAQVYNDQFYTNGRQVIFQDGTPVWVLPTKTQIVAPNTAGGVPLTIDLMNSASSRYYANPVAISGAITSNSQVATILKTTDPVHGSILTGATGLPISDLQIAPNPLAPPPGTINVTRSGDLVTGFPKYSANLTNMYTFREGALSGFRIGGSIVGAWKNQLYYYYPSGVKVPTSRTMYYLPNRVIVSGIFGWEHRFPRFTFSTQLNIQNMFNHYHVVLLPSYVNGWAGPNNATFDQQPRMYVWSSTVSF